MKAASTLAVLLAMFVALPAFGQESTREDFVEFAKAMQGRWVGKFTWSGALPGVGKEGETATSHFEGRFVADGRAFTGTMSGGDSVTTLLMAYDAGKKQVSAMIVDSGGNVTRVVYVKAGKKWMAEETGSSADGKKIKLRSELTISDGGKTQTWVTKAKLGDGPTKTKTDVWRRVHDGSAPK